MTDEAAPLATRIGPQLERWFNPEAVGIRQAPFTIAFACSALLALTLGGGQLSSRVWVGFAITIAAQVAGLLVPWPKLPHVWQSVLPLAQFVALVELEVGSGAPLTYFTVLLFLPVVSLGLQESSLGVVFATLGTVAAVQAIGILNRITDPYTVAIRSAVIPLTALLVALGTYGVTSRLRTRTRALRELQAEQARALAQLSHNRDELTAMTERLHATTDTLFQIIDAATLHAIIATELDGSIMVFNKGAEALLGYPRKDVLGTDVLQLYDADELQAAADAGDHHRPLTAAVGDAGAGQSSVREWTFRRRDGEPVPVEVVVTRRPPPLDGGAPGYLFVVTGIAERRESDRLQDEFVGLVSHELRTPLTGILGYLELMRMGPDLTGEQANDLDIIDRSAQRLLRLVNDLLLSVELSAGTFNLIAEEMDLAEVARASAKAMATSAEAAGVELVVAADRPVQLYGDPVRLAQVVENLLGNAIKFTPRGGTVTLRVHPGIAVEGQHTGVIRVIDTGIGIGPSDLAQLTVRFYRARSARGRRIRGIGLGLSITQAIVEAHHGHLRVESVLGSGTTVTATVADLPPEAEH